MMFKRMLGSVLAAALLHGSDLLRIPRLEPDHMPGFRNRGERRIPAYRERAKNRRRSGFTIESDGRDPWTIMVARLTNWQRNQWARAGYPGLRHKDITLLQPFSVMARR